MFYRDVAILKRLSSFSNSSIENLENDEFETKKENEDDDAILHNTVCAAIALTDNGLQLGSNSTINLSLSLYT